MCTVCFGSDGSATQFIRRPLPRSHHRGPRPNLTIPGNPLILLQEVTQAILTSSILVKAAPVPEQVAIQLVEAIHLVATPISIQEEADPTQEDIPTRIQERVAILLVATLISIREEVDPTQEDIPTRIQERVATQLAAAILRLVATPISIREEVDPTQEGIPTRIQEQVAILLVATLISIREEVDPTQEDIPTRIQEQVPIQLAAAILRLVATPIREEADPTQEDIPTRILEQVPIQLVVTPIQEEVALTLEDIPTRILQEGVTLTSIRVEVGTALVGIQRPGGYPGGQPSIGGGYPNWNPNNKILSPRYGGSFGGGGFGMGGSPFSNTVKSMGYGSSLKSKGFAKKAMLAAGVGAMAGMAVGYGIGNFQRPNFEFRSPQEERQYNHYMYKHQGTRSKDKSNKGGPNNTSKQQSQAHMSYEQYMNTCMKRKDLLKEQDTTDSTDRKNIQRDEPLTEVTMKIDYQGGPEKNDTASPTTASDYPKASAIREEDDDTVSIVQIGYPALIEQMKARKCVEMFLVYSESFAEKQKEDKKDNQRRNISSFSNNHNGLCVSGVLLLLTTSFMPLSST
ncbi:hypothetical protein M9458_021747 [Cirrhinus mrigala]|uniref:Uncharacterized protein n=1 Tax=Cirrhinus mrigala TaxID=683832 RepID=A0ABD0Q842_CIRMR